MTQQAVNRDSARLVSLDIVRGYAMLAMLVSHSSWWITELDYRVAYGWDNMIVPQLGTPESWIGYVLQIASPAFFLLSGFSIALFCASRQRRGWTAWQITRFLLVRGAVLVLLDLTVMNLDFSPPYYHTRLSVLTGIGLCLSMVALLRFLPLRWLVVALLVTLAGTQGWYYLNDWPQTPSLLRAVLLAPSLMDSWFVQFPVLPWLPVMLLGYVCGLLVLNGQVSLGRFALRLGVILVLLWLPVVWLNSFGNLYPDHRLIFGKHPPDLAYLLLYVGVVFLLIALHERLVRPGNSWLAWALVMLGQTALFFYVVHVRVIELFSPLVIQWALPPLAQSALIALAALPVHLSMCYVYRHYKRQHPGSVLQYL